MVDVGLYNLCKNILSCLFPLYKEKNKALYIVEGSGLTTVAFSVDIATVPASLGTPYTTVSARIHLILSRDLKNLTVSTFNLFPPKNLVS